MNTTYLERMFFRDSAGRESYGWTLEDNYSRLFTKGLGFVPSTRYALLQYVIANGTVEELDVLDLLKEEKRGLFIDSEWFDYERIKVLL